jgi:hypothetical protein
MKKTIAIAVVSATMVVLAFAGTATADAGIKKLAKQECKVERATDRAEFVAKYGGTGKAALKRCVKAEKREARADCKEDRREEPAEFAVEYGGTGKAALKRCVADELR